MSDSPSPVSPASIPADDRLDSWKEIAAYLKRDVTTAQRWEKREGMPVHRHLHEKMGSVFALRTELDRWTRTRRVAAAGGASGREPAEPPEAPPSTDEGTPADRPTAVTSGRGLWIVAIVLVTAAVAGSGVIARLQRQDAFWRNPIADARFVRLTDSEGADQAAAISRDGRFAAFLSDRDGRIDLWVTQVGTGSFHNLSRDVSRELVNPSIRTLEFSPDGALVSFWTRQSEGAKTNIGIWAVPILGGQPRPFLPGAAELDWSGDGSRVVYHTPGPGDPMFVKGANETDGRQIFAAPTGLHSHFIVWSMDQAYIYFVQGVPSERMDIWRIRPSGGPAERITHHESSVSHPVFINPRTLIYLATDASGGGPWMYAIDVERRVPHRVSSGVDTYTSVAASADGRRLVATLASMKTTLWRLPGAAAAASTGTRMPLTTGSGFSPRLGPGYVVYVSSQGESDSIWKQQGDGATELWTAPGARIVGGPSIDSAGRRLAFSVRQNGQALMYVINADGTGATIVDQSRNWQGAPAWTADGRSITAAALESGVPHLFTMALDGRSPAPLGHEHALDPVWSPDGRFVVFSGADVGTTFPLKAIAADGTPQLMPNLTLSRGGRHVRFLPGNALVVLRGDIRHKNLWSIDLATGAEHQLTNLPPDFEVRDFDMSPDGGEIVLERAQAHSEIVLLDVPRR